MCSPAVYLTIPNNSPPAYYFFDFLSDLPFLIWTPRINFPDFCFVDLSEIVKMDCSICKTLGSLVQTILISYQSQSRLNLECKLSEGPGRLLLLTESLFQTLRPLSLYLDPPPPPCLSIYRLSVKPPRPYYLNLEGQKNVSQECERYTTVWLQNTKHQQ